MLDLSYSGSAPEIPLEPVEVPDINCGNCNKQGQYGTFQVINFGLPNQKYICNDCLEVIYAENREKAQKRMEDIEKAKTAMMSNMPKREL